MPSSYLTANSIASIRLKYVWSSGGRAPGLHPRGHARDARDRVDRMAEQVAVVHTGAPAELAHRLAQGRLDERVDHHRRPAARVATAIWRSSTDLDARVADLLEHLLRELRLEGEHEPRRRLARRVRDDVQLDRGVVGGHARRVSGRGCPMRAGRAGIGLERGGIPVREVPDTIAGVAGPSFPVSLADVESAARRLDGVAVRTPLLRLPLEGEVYVKPESLQRTGSFKFRGAFNALAATPLDGSSAASSPIQRQPRPGCRCGRRAPRRPATIVMPENAAPVKVARTARWGAEIVRCANSSDERRRVAAEMAALRGRSSTSHPSTTDGSSPGRARWGSRWHGHCPKSRRSSSGRRRRPDLRDRDRRQGALPGARVDRGRAGARRRRAGVVPRGPDRELARRGRDEDDLRRRSHAGSRRADVRDDLALVDEIVTVSDEAVLEAMRRLALEAKLLVEPTGALALAAMQTGIVARAAVRRFSSRRAGTSTPLWWHRFWERRPALSPTKASDPRRDPVSQRPDGRRARSYPRASSAVRTKTAIPSRRARSSMSNRG